ncbi:MAG TPA: twin-arginine translocation signal domain-containing protein, partial [Polyangia bacterium]
MVAQRLSRRGFLKGAAASPVVSFLASCAPAETGEPAQGPLLGFSGVPISKADEVVVPDGYTWTVVNAWGDPIVRGGPAWK